MVFLFQTQLKGDNKCNDNSRAIVPQGKVWGTSG